LDIVLISAQDRCIVCIKCTMGMEIALGTPDGSARLCMSSGRLFQSIWRYF
jgi:hypothetical protein